MIRNALVALDGSRASQVATQMAISHVKQADPSAPGGPPISLTGLAVLDAPTITKPEPTPVGAGSFKKERDEALLAAADHKTLEILDEFAAACRAAGVECATQRLEGLPFDAITAAGRVHDLIVIGRETNFHFQTSDDPCETFKLLVRDHPCPLIITPNEYPTGKAVIIAYDGSRAASRALHLFGLTEPDLEEMDVHVVTVDDDPADAQANCAEAVAFLRGHDVHAHSHPIASNESPTETLIETADKLGARLIVMGAFGHRGWSTVFFGSTTRHMLDECRYPLFVY